MGIMVGGAEISAEDKVIYRPEIMKLIDLYEDKIKDGDPKLLRMRLEGLVYKAIETWIEVEGL